MAENNNNKATKNEADYVGTAPSPDKSCKVCRFFVYPNECTKVEGEISPGATSKFFELKKERLTRFKDMDKD